MACPAIDARVVVPVASDTIRHVCKFERRYDFAHRLNFTMAFLAGDVFHDVRLMIEIDEVREHIHLCPPNRHLLIPCLADLLNLGFRRSNKLMTSHAGLHRRNHRSFSSACTAVAILAAHLIVPRVNLMAERDRLTRLQFLLPAAGCDDEHESNRKEIKYSKRKF